jgi:WXG100 family type VII secretion target
MAGDGTRYTVKYSEVAGVIEDMGFATNNIRDTLNDLMVNISTNLSPENWTQQAKDVFHAANLAWAQDTQHMHDVLKTAETTLLDIITNYDITDKQAAAMYGQVGL